MSKYKFDIKAMCLWAMALPLCVLLAGCGGGGANGAAGSRTTVSGIAASGKSVSGGVVQMVCANSAPVGMAVVSGADGSFSVDAPGSAPCVIRVSGGDITGGGPLFSVVTSPAQKHTNVNQLTTMLAFLLAGTNPDAGLFQSAAVIQSRITPTAVATFKEMIRANVIANLGGAAGIPTNFDFLEDTFVANNLGFDAMLDKLGFVPGTTASIMFNGSPMLAVNATTGVASTTSSTVVSSASFNAAGPSGDSTPNTVVSTANMRGWSFINDCGVGAPSGALVSGPASPPLGMGSAQLTVGAANECMMLATQAYIGTMLSHLTSMNYASYQSGPTAAVALQFDVRYHPGDAVYQGRLVFEPYQGGAVLVGPAWQNWSALDGKWWASKTSAVGSNGLCPQSSPCTWSQIQLNWPGASILGSILFKAGSGWTAFSGNVDAFAIGIDGVITTYDFE
jgi:hypothetical protein